MHICPNEMQNDLEIVNHEVEHDPDISAAIREGESRWASMKRG
jgi:hypothetical protein